MIDEEYRTEYVIDRLVTSSTVWMGLTMTCGRCHDHKFDPISQREFYQLLAFFNNSPDRGLNGFDPKLQVASPLQAGEAARLQSQLEATRHEFDALAATHAAEFEAWQRQVTEETRDAWSTVVPERSRVRKVVPSSRHRQIRASWPPAPILPPMFTNSNGR